MPQIQALLMEHWRQFHSVQLSFHPQLTIITGANGAGKTTLLNIISKCFGWNFRFTATPRKSQESLDYDSSLDLSFLNYSESNSWVDVGSISWEDGVISRLMIPYTGTREYDINIRPPKIINGVYFPAHRPIFRYGQVDKIPIQPPKPNEMSNRFSDYNKSWFFGGTNATPTLLMKEYIISFAMFGYGNDYVKPNIYMQDMFEGISRILSIIIPKNLGFQKLEIRIPEVVLVTQSGDFPIDAVSGGLASIIDLCWNIFLRSVELDDFLVLIDEPESHLHPQMQRSIIPDLLAAFPKVQFIVATHSPLVISSAEDSEVFALTYNESNKVVSKQLDFVNKSGTSNEILREVLGMDETIPIWAADKIDIIIEEMRRTEFSQESLSVLEQKLQELGIQFLLPSYIDKIIHKKDDA